VRSLHEFRRDGAAVGRRLKAPPAPRAELLRALILPDLERAERIGEFWSYRQSRTFAELLIDLGEERLRKRSSGLLREMERGR
jgi:hypothetical protein